MADRVQRGWFMSRPCKAPIRIIQDWNEPNEKERSLVFELSFESASVAWNLAVMVRDVAARQSRLCLLSLGH